MVRVSWTICNSIPMLAGTLPEYSNLNLMTMAWIPKFPLTLTDFEQGWKSCNYEVSRLCLCLGQNEKLHCDF